MVRSALATYQDLGYRTADGQIPAWKLEEILFLDDCLAQARADKAEQERQERLDAVGGRNG